MKTKEELNALKEEVETLNALKEEVETLNQKLAELSDEELSQIAGGGAVRLPDGSVVELPGGIDLERPIELPENSYNGFLQEARTESGKQFSSREIRKNSSHFRVFFV